MEGRRSPSVRLALGTRVRELRTSRGLSQERLAELSGLHRTYISSLERGQRNVSVENLGALAQALDITIAELFPPNSDT
jgi:transcriptional regulator with XRE-family HTH domain